MCSARFVTSYERNISSPPTKQDLGISLIWRSTKNLRRAAHPFDIGLLPWVSDQFISAARGALCYAHLKPSLAKKPQSLRSTPRVYFVMNKLLRVSSRKKKSVKGGRQQNLVPRHMEV